MDPKPSLTKPSNEQIIDDLTKDFQDSCHTQRSNETSTSPKYETANKHNTVEDVWPTGMEKGLKPEEHKVNVDRNEVPDEDCSNELRLKDREITLSEDDKQKLRVEAEASKNEGNDLFKAGEYANAEASYTRGLSECPLAFPSDRAILYANRAAAKMKYMNDKDPAIADCTKAIELNPNYVRAYLRRAQLREEEKQLDNALADFKKILELDPSNTAAHHAIRRLPPLIEEANEKLKTEMLGKLKDLGNLVLRPFGLSTNNFELQQDPGSGGYSVKFNQNSN